MDRYRGNDVTDIVKAGQGLGWVGVIRKVYEVDPLICLTCGGEMKVISLIEDHKLVDRIYLELSKQICFKRNLAGYTKKIEREIKNPATTYSPTPRPEQYHRH